MLKGPISRTRHSERLYSDYKKKHGSRGCDFCKFTAQSSQIIDTSRAFWIAKNIFGYDLWDGCRVLEHLMIIPKRHVDSIADFTDKEKLDYLDIIATKEKQGYSLYSRAPQNITKSIPHQHTHLLRIEDKRISSALYIRKPHLLLFK